MSASDLYFVLFHKKVEQMRWIYLLHNNPANHK